MSKASYGIHEPIHDRYRNPKVFSPAPVSSGQNLLQAQRNTALACLAATEVGIPHAGTGAEMKVVMELWKNTWPFLSPQTGVTDA
jgi:hypothetical protein